MAPLVISLVNGGNTFYFPSCHIWRRLNKNLILIKLPKINIGADLLRWTEEIRIEGVWLDDDVDKKYDSRTAFARYDAFFNLFSKGSPGEIAQKASILVWGSYRYKILVKSFSCTKAGGEGTAMNYNLAMVRVTKDLTDPVS